ncbi:MAG: radical SAM protein [Planctomycetota bacterium]
MTLQNDATGSPACDVATSHVTATQESGVPLSTRGQLPIVEPEAALGPLEKANEHSQAVPRKKWGTPASGGATSRRPAPRWWSAVTRLPGFISDCRRFRRRDSAKPRLLTHTITFGCNARCVMCDSWKLPTGDDLTLSEIIAVYEQLPKMDVVRLTGGEPFVRKDFPEIVSAATRILDPLTVHITTNGFLTRRIVDFLRDRDPTTHLDLLISVDGEGDKHNQIRGHSKAWSLVTDTIDAIAPNRQDWNVSLAVNQTVVDAEGAEHYRRLHDRWKKQSIAHHLVIAYDSSATYSIDRDVDLAPKTMGEFLTFGDTDRTEMASLLDQAIEDTRHLPFAERWAKRYYLRGIRSRIVDGRGDPNPACVALSAHLRMFPNGDVPTCQFNSHIVGNLRDSSFADLWKDDSTKKARQWVRQCPGCWAECEVIPNAVYTLDMLGRSRSHQVKA